VDKSFTKSSAHHAIVHLTFIYNNMHTAW